jgi:hypothetical protein
VFVFDIYLVFQLSVPVISYDRRSSAAIDEWRKGCVGIRLVGMLASPTRADVASRVQREHLEKRLIVWRFMGDDDKVAGHFVPSELTGERSIP